MFERSDLFPNHVVTNWTWVCPLAEQQSQFIDTGLWWRKILCLVQGSAKRTGSSRVKDPNSPMAFRELFFFFLMCLLIHRLCWVFVAVHGLSLVAESWSRSLVVLGLLIAMASRCRAQTQDRWLWHMGLVAPWHIESSQTRDWTCVPWIGRWILNHRTTREVPGKGF